MSTPDEQLAAFLVSMFNICLRPQRKAMSAALVQRLTTLVHDAVANGDPIYDLLDDLLSQPAQPIKSDRVTQVFERDGNDAIPDQRFQSWRGNQQRWEDGR